MGVFTVEAKDVDPFQGMDVPGPLMSRFEKEGLHKWPVLRILHTGLRDPVAFDVADESNGTKAFLTLTSRTLSAISKAGTICIDELDASLHSLLATSLVHRFLGRESNPKGAQLIFATHETNLLSNNLLRRDQIWFTEKDKNRVSHLYPLSDFNQQPNENLETGYLQGRYGAIPFINNSNAFLTAMAKNYGKKGSPAPEAVS